VRKFGNDSHPQCGEDPKPFTKRTHQRHSRSPSMFKSLIEGSRGRCRLVRQAHIQAEESALMALVRVDSLVATVANARHGIATTVDLPRGISNDPCCPSDLCERNCDTLGTPISRWLDAAMRSRSRIRDRSVSNITCVYTEPDVASKNV